MSLFDGEKKRTPAQILRSLKAKLRKKQNAAKKKAAKAKIRAQIAATRKALGR
jgi:hypothetical protein